MSVGFLRALVTNPWSYDDSRLEQLFTAIVQTLPPAPAPPEVISLVTYGVRSHDYRKVAVCVRLLAHLRLVYDCEMLDVSQFFGHAEPLVRHAVLYAARMSRSSLLLTQCPWKSLLFDDSMWVYTEAHQAFVCALTLGLVSNHASVLQELFQNENPLHERALIALVAALLAEPSLRNSLQFCNLVSLLMDRFVIGKPVGFECGAALEVFGRHVPDDDSMIWRWFRACLADGMLSTASLLATHCRSQLQEQMLSEIVESGGPEVAMPLVKRMKPNSPSGTSVCVAVLQSPFALEKWKFVACGILQSWGHVVLDETLLISRLLDPTKPRLWRMALTLSSPLWNGSARVQEQILRLAVEQDGGWPPVWECVARHNVIALAPPCIESFCSASIASETKICAWRSVIPWIGPSHPQVERMVRAALESHQSLAHVQTALRVLCGPEWSGLANDAQCVAVSRCIRECQDDSDAPLAALAWIRTFPERHPEVSLLLNVAVAHSARAVRQAVWQLLADCGHHWPDLQHLSLVASARAQAESAKEVYGDPFDTLDSDPMLDRGEPDCCE